MITLKQYLDYVNLKDDADTYDKLLALTNYTRSELENMSMKKVAQILTELQQIDFEADHAYIQLPYEYGKLTFGQWADIEHFSNQVTDNYRVAKEIAVVLLKEDRDLEKVNRKAEELLKLDAKIAVPLVSLHLKKKMGQETDSLTFTRKMSAIRNSLLQNLEQIKKTKFDRRTHGTRWQRIWHKTYFILTKYLKCLAIKYSILSTTKIK